MFLAAIIIARQTIPQFKEISVRIIRVHMVIHQGRVIKIPALIFLKSADAVTDGTGNFFILGIEHFQLSIHKRLLAGEA
jgi:hypothetical protein